MCVNQITCMTGHCLGNAKYSSHLQKTLAHHQISSELLTTPEKSQKLLGVLCWVLSWAGTIDYGLFDPPYLLFQIFKFLLKLQIDLFSGQWLRRCHIGCGNQSKSHLRHWYGAAAGYLNIVQGI